MHRLKELITILFDPQKIKSTCFMCYKQGDNMMNVLDSLHIENQWFNITLSLKCVIKYIFPMQDITLSSACQLCTDTLLKIYICIRQKEHIENYINGIIHKINSNIYDNGLKSPLFIEFEDNQRHKNKEDETYKNITNEDFDEKDDIDIREPLFEMPLKIKHFKKRKRKSYNCDICPYSTKCNTTLEGHRNSKHFHLRPHICIVCNKSFYTKSALKEHRKTHKNHKDIICEVCGETFCHNKTLKDHLKLHSNDKTYECYVCNHRFVNQSRVNSHMKQKHGEKKELCVVCGKKFAFKKDVVRHIKFVHNRESIINHVNQSIFENT